MASGMDCFKAFMKMHSSIVKAWQAMRNAWKEKAEGTLTSEGLRKYKNDYSYARDDYRSASRDYKEGNCEDASGVPAPTFPKPQFPST